MDSHIFILFSFIWTEFVLPVSPIIDCGHCLIGGQRVAEFKVKNEGGNGRFCIMPKERWPATNFRVGIDEVNKKTQPKQTNKQANKTKQNRETKTGTCSNDYNNSDNDNDNN